MPGTFGMSDPNTLSFIICRLGITNFGMPESREAAPNNRFFGFLVAGFLCVVLGFLRFILFAQAITLIFFGLLL